MTFSMVRFTRSLSSSAPSDTEKVTGCTPAWLKPGVHRNWPLSELSVAPAGRSCAPKVSGSPSMSSASSVNSREAISAPAFGPTGVSTGAWFTWRTASVTVSESSRATSWIRKVTT